MYRYLASRLLLAVPTLIGATFIVFAIMRIAPGDVVDVIVGDGDIPESERIALREELGLNDALPVQYGRWLLDLATLDVGESLVTDREILPDLRSRALVTGELAIGAIVISMLIAIPLGTLSALKQDSPLDYLLRVVSIGGLSLPSFWVATVLLIGLSRLMGWIPPIQYAGLFDDPVTNFKQMFLPMLVLGYALAAVVSRLTRSSVLEVLRDDYVRTARAKGLNERTVVVRHALRNALLPVITVSGAQLGYLLGGTVIMESIFTIPGVGQYTLDAILRRDYPAVQFCIVFMAAVQILANLATDVSYGVIDPRIRYR